MSKNVAMFVDVANMYYAARGQDVDVDYVALLKHATKGRDLIRAYAYTGLDPENENQRKFIDFLGKNGYKPVIKDIRKFGDGRMKANLDIELVVDLFRLADRMDIAVIVSGDGDFAPAIKALQDKGVRCEVISFKPNTSSDLIAVADEFMDIMKVASISRKEGRAVRDSMSAPEMPAKEVNPEFGFREASPSVAAAALAAIRGGSAGAGTATTGRRTTRSAAPRRGLAPAAAAAADEAVEDAPVPVAAADDAADASEETRRRRRRRGGRGRGRTRREEEGGPSAVAGEEIGWEELDDLSQVDGLDVPDVDREYSFEEADADTLAELGLSPEELAAMVGPVDETSLDEAPVDPEPSPQEEKPKRRRSTRAKQTTDQAPVEATGAVPQTEPATEDEKPKRRRSTRARQADEAAAVAPGPVAAPEEAAPATDDEKPKARRSSRSASKDGDGGAEKPTRRRSTRASGSSESDAAGPAEGAAASGEAGAEPQGIWGRFRSARKPRSGSSSS